jgi:hypothetical protein
MKKTLIKTVLGRKIYFVEETEQFVCDDWKTNSLSEMVRIIEKESKEEFKGEFYLKEYNGIEKFTAQKKFYSDYEDKWKVRGIQIDKYGSEKEEVVDFDNLYPKNEINDALFEEAKKLNEDGWRLIRKGENLRYKLVSSPKHK